MPRRCCVPGCKGNYEGQPYSTVFCFPKDPDKRLKWIKAIHRDNFEPGKSSVVCSQHFNEQYIIRMDRATRDDGSELLVPRTIPKLTDDAYPSIFPNQPSYLSSDPPPKRRAPEERTQDANSRNEGEFQQWCNDDSLSSFKDLKTKIIGRDTFDYTVVSYDKSVLFFRLDICDKPHIIVSLRIKTDLSIEVYHNDLLIAASKFRWVLGDNLLCDKMSKFDCILSHLKSLQPDVNATSIEVKLENVTHVLDSCLDQCDTSSPLAVKIKFLNEQVKLSMSKQARYSPEMLIWACTVFFTYPASYRLIRSSAVFTLPHPSYLKKLSMELGTNHSGIQNSHLTYLKEKCKILPKHELLVNLLLDEIYVKPSVCYKGGKIEGLCENDLNSGASTIQAFMMTSVFSKNKDVVGLFPVKNLTAGTLLELTEKVICILTEAGFEILTLISDNNRVNRKMFETLCGGKLSTSFRNKFKTDIDSQIFVLFDSVHLFKCVRNNWLNQTDTSQTFIIPETFNTSYCKPSSDSSELELATKIKTCERQYASVCHLKRLYNDEKADIVKLAPTLSKKVLFPTSMERQNVSYVVKLFDEKNIAALKTVEQEWDSNVTGTIQFMEIVSKWWRIVNVKHPLKGKHLRDAACDPILAAENDKNLLFLDVFVKWLDKWENIVGPETVKVKGKPNKRHGKLTLETAFSLRHTTITLIALAKYLLNNNHKTKYVLLGKFQTDHLEARFGQYRQMSGGNYHVSVTQILESEKKLKLISLVNLQSAKSGEFQIKTFLSSCSESSAAVASDEADMVIDEHFEDAVSFADVIEVTDANMRVLIYIAGYVARGVTEKLKCINCKNFLVYDRSLEIDCKNDELCNYLNLIDRGGLKWPKDFIVHVIIHTFQMFQSVISSRFEEQFLASKNQRSLLHILSIEKLEISGCMLGVCSCGVNMSILAGYAVKIMSNILLNNYCKMKNNAIQDNIVKSKKRKLKTLTEATTRPTTSITHVGLTGRK